MITRLRCSHQNCGKAVTAMMWSDKAFQIYMGDAGTLTPVDATVDSPDSFDAAANRMDVRGTDPCSDGEAKRTSWLQRAGTSLTDTQVHSAVRG
jgi:hypothetical protein